MGRVSDPDAASDEDISKAESAFKSIGISIRNMNGEFKEVPIVLDELNVKWATLTKTQRSYIAEEAAGVRQKNVFLNLMDGYTRSTELNTQAIDSNGFAMERNAIFMDSIIGRTKSLTASTEIFWQNLISTDTVKEFITTLDKMVTGLDALVGNSFASFITQSGLLTLAIALLGKGFVALKASTLGTAVGLWAIDVAQKGLIVSTKALTTAMFASPLFWVAVGSLAIVGIVKMVQYLNGAYERQVKALEELKHEYNLLSQSLEDNETKHQKVIDRLKELYNLRNSNEITDTEKEELTRLEQVNIELKRQIDYQKALIAIKGTELEKETLDLSKKKTEKIDIFGSNAVLVTAADKIEIDTQLLKKYQDQLDNVTTSKEALKETLVDLRSKFSDTSPEIEDVIAKIKELENQENDLNASISTHVSNLEELIKKLEDENKAYQGNTEEGTAKKEANEALIVSTQELIISLQGIVDVIDAVGDGDLPDKYETAAEKAERLAKQQEALNKALKDSVDSFNDVTGKIKSLHKIQDELNTSQELSASSMEEIISKHPELIHLMGDRVALEIAIANAIRTQEETQREAYQNMLINSTTYFNETIKGNETLWNTLGKAYGTDLDNFNSLADAKLNTDNYLRQAIGDGWSKLYGSQEQALQAMFSQFMANGIPQNDPAFMALKAHLAAVQGVKKGVQATWETMDFGKVNLGDIKTGNAGGGGSGSTKENYKPIIDAYHQISIELSKINNLLAENQTLLDQAEGSAKISLLQKRTDLYEQQKKALQDLNKEQQKDLELTKSLLSNMGFTFDSDNNITNYSTKLKEKIGDAAKEAENLISHFTDLHSKEIPSTINQILALSKSIKDIGKDIETYISDTFNAFYSNQTKNIETQISLLEESKKAAQDASDAIIKGYEDQIKNLERINSEQKESEERTKRQLDLAKQQEKLTNIASQKNVQLFKDGKWQWVANPQKVREETERLQEMQLDYNKWEADIAHQHMIQKLRDQIQAEKDLLEAKLEGYDKDIEALKEFLTAQQELYKETGEPIITSMKELKEALSEVDAAMYSDRLKALESFLGTYNTLLSSVGSDSIENLYESLLGRPSDESGKAHFSKLLSSGKMSLSEIEKAIKNSPEYLGKFDTGGYTGEWAGNDGKLAVLHKKEFVLNEGMAGNLIKILNSSAHPNINVMKPNIPNITPSGKSNSGTTQNVYITVEKVQTNDAKQFIRNLMGEVNNR